MAIKWIKLLFFQPHFYEKKSLMVSQSLFDPLSANPTKWSITLKQFFGNSRQIVWVCLTILLGWRLKGWGEGVINYFLKLHLLMFLLIVFTDARCVFFLNLGNKHEMESFDKPCLRSHLVLKKKYLFFHPWKKNLSPSKGKSLPCTCSVFLNKS